MNIKLKINSVPGFTGVVTIDADKHGTPLDRFWRNRLKDAIADNCVEVVVDHKTKKQKVNCND